MSLFEPRAHYKPFRYPSVVPFKKAIHESFWTVHEFNFLSDVQDYHCRIDGVERQALKRTLLAISQVEVSVKRFWARLGDRLPSPEIEAVGVVFGDCEVRHADAYSHLLELLDLNAEFEAVAEVPAIRDRIEVLKRAMAGSRGNPREYAMTLALFSLLVENCSLFTQFLIVKSFNKEKNLFKDIDNVVQATAREEALHALFGAHLVGLMKEEAPHWFGEEFHQDMQAAAIAAYHAEVAIIDWIFEGGAPTFLRKGVVVEFLKDRVNGSLRMLGVDPVFRVDDDVLARVRWFDEEVHAPIHTDFFHKKSVAYTRNAQPVTAESIF